MIDEIKVVEKWNLREWWDRATCVEDVIAKITETKQSSRNIEQVLIFNYGRTVLCIKEILTLLMHGYPDGALSIARTVYEIMIITKFIYDKYEEDNETDLIELYFADHNVKAYKPLLKLHEWLYSCNCNIEEMKERIEGLKKEIAEINDKYGKTHDQYWWAQKEFEKRVTFKKIDDITNSHLFLRVLYERACIGIHASSMGSIALLGRQNELGNVIYTTPTDEGFEVPLLLGMVSHDMLVEILCKHWNLDEEAILSNMDELYEKYTINCLS